MIGAVDQGAGQPRQVPALPADRVPAAAAAGVGEQLVAGAADGREAPLSSSVLNGSKSATRMPITLVRWLRRLRATRLDS